jgi:hypothetical protein
VLKDPARMQNNPFERIRKKQLKTNARRELTIAELTDILEKAEGIFRPCSCWEHLPDFDSETAAH